jgi:hypothetical protein
MPDMLELNFLKLASRSTTAYAAQFLDRDLHVYSESLSAESAGLFELPITIDLKINDKF